MVKGMSIENKRIAYAVLLILVSVYSISVLVELDPNYDVRYPDYHDNILPYLDNCDLTKFPSIDSMIMRNPLKNWFLCLSLHTFDNANVIPMLFSIGILPLTFVLAKQLSGKYLVGLMSVVALMLSPTFTNWDTTGTYDQSWTFFLLVSLVTPFMYLSVIVSILCKTLTVLYLPMWFITVWKRMHMIEKIVVTISTVVISILVLFLFSTSELSGGSYDGLNVDELLWSIWKLPAYFTEDPIITTILVTVPLLFIHRNKIKNSRKVLGWILWILLTVPLIEGFTSQLVHPYRFVPLVVFVSIALSQVLQFYISKIQERRLKQYV